MCSRLILNIFIDSLFKLFSWDVRIIGFLDELLELSRGYLSSHYRIYGMYSLSRRVVLCHHWPDCSDGYLCCWEILNRLIDHMLKLSRWNFSGVNRIFFMYSMYRRVILCHDRFDCRYRRMCSRILLNCVFHCMFELRSRDILGFSFLD